MDGDGAGDVCDSSNALTIDIKPGSSKNPINPGSKGVIPVAILGSANLDVTRIDVTTLEMTGNDGTSSAHDLTDPDTYAEHLQDVNNDGLTDLVSHYKTQNTGVAKGDTEMCLSAKTVDNNVDVEGCDSIKTVGKK